MPIAAARPNGSRSLWTLLLGASKSQGLKKQPINAHGPNIPIVGSYEPGPTRFLQPARGPLSARRAALIFPPFPLPPAPRQTTSGDIPPRLQQQTNPGSPPPPAAPQPPSPNGSHQQTPHPSPCPGPRPAFKGRRTPSSGGTFFCPHGNIAKLQKTNQKPQWPQKMPVNPAPPPFHVVPPNNHEKIANRFFLFCRH